MRYEVDLSDHQRTAELRNSPLPSRGGVYNFEATLSVGFRVTDPAEIVRRNVTDGLTIVYGYLATVSRDITWDFDIEEARAAEDAINARFRHGDSLAEGITLYLCRARLAPDARARDYLRAQEEAKRSNVVKGAEHETAVDDAKRENQIKLIRQSGDLLIRASEQDALAGRPMNIRELISIHLERHPDDTERALVLMEQFERGRLERQDTQEQRWRELFQFMASRDLVQPVDVARFRDQAMAQLQGPPAALLGAGGWDDPLPELSATPPSSPLQVPSARADAAGTVPSVSEVHEVPGVVPVYVVLDQSLAVQAWVAELNAGMGAVYDALLAEPRVAAIVRLSVLAYSDDAAVQLDLTAIGAGTRRPELSAHGQSQYAAAFSRLLDCIPRDVEQLKAARSAVRRPQVLFLTAAQPTDASAWSSVHRQLVDRDHQRYAPDIVACGIGGVDADTIARVATRPEFGFVALGDTSSAIRQYFDFVARQVLGYGRAVLDGAAGPVLYQPEGFVPAREDLV
jgi:uncharacterized protein YegL